LVNAAPKAFALLTDAEIANLRIVLSEDGGLTAQADFKSGRRDLPGIVMYPSVSVPRPTGIEPVFGREPDRLHGLDDIHGMLGYVDGVVQSFDGDISDLQARASTEMGQA
jgi:hypothetical protein